MHGIGAVILVDGGVHLILKGDEASIGTAAEDLCSLATVSSLTLPTKLIACIGMGAELRDGIRHAQVLERFAELTKAGGFLGTTSLAAADRLTDAYRDLLQFVSRGHQEHKRSHIQSVILRALDGEFGADGQHTWLSPLLHLYWFFDLESVAKTHLFLDSLKHTEDIWQIAPIVEACRREIGIRDPTAIPI